MERLYTIFGGDALRSLSPEDIQKILKVQGVKRFDIATESSGGKVVVLTLEGEDQDAVSRDWLRAWIRFPEGCTSDTFRVINPHGVE